MYKTSGCTSKRFKEFALIGFFFVFIFGIIVFSYIISGAEPNYTKTIEFEYISMGYGGVSILYSFVVKYHLYKNFQI